MLHDDSRHDAHKVELGRSQALSWLVIINTKRANVNAPRRPQRHASVEALLLGARCMDFIVVARVLGQVGNDQDGQDGGRGLRIVVWLVGICRQDKVAHAVCSGNGGTAEPQLLGVVNIAGEGRGGRGLGNDVLVLLIKNRNNTMSGGEPARTKLRKGSKARVVGRQSSLSARKLGALHEMEALSEGQNFDGRKKKEAYWALSVIFQVWTTKYRMFFFFLLLRNVQDSGELEGFPFAGGFRHTSGHDLLLLLLSW